MTPEAITKQGIHTKYTICVSHACYRHLSRYTMKRDNRTRTIYIFAARLLVLVRSSGITRKLKPKGTIQNTCGLVSKVTIRNREILTLQKADTDVYAP